MKTVDLLIVGGGPAGLGAALAAHESGVKNILIVEREKNLGGIFANAFTWVLDCNASKKPSAVRNTPTAL